MLARLRLQERFEASDVGRAVISAWLIVTIVALVAINMPSRSYLRDKVMSVAEPYLNATALDQNWRVFAANPRHISVDLRARVRYADGRSGEWRLPHGSALFGDYWDYRWRKWMENTVLGNRQALWRPAAIYIARQEQEEGRRPVEVTLVRRLRPLYPPGTPRADRGRWTSQPYFRTRIRPDMLQ
jgi:hypothetical protein